MGELEGRTALVTGASRGIGREIARRFAAEGARVVVTARSLDRAPEHLGGTLSELVEEIRAEGGWAFAVAADLAAPASRSHLHAQAVEALGEPIDVLVNNAAAAFYLPFLRYSENRYRVAMEINLHAPWDLCRQVIPAMQQRGRGWIVNLSSATARLPEGPPFDDYARRFGAILYGTTKAALNRFTRGLAAEMQQHGIAVNSVEPIAVVRTPGVLALGIDTTHTVVETPACMAEAALALATADPAKLTGRIAQATPLLEELGRPTHPVAEPEPVG